ncbi:MAG: tetratricopeptide repeat protein, partial [Anaerolineae bacterium]
MLNWYAVHVTTLEQKLATLPESVQTALLASAVPAWFDAELLGALLDDLEAGQSSLATLVEQEFISPDPDHPETYRLEPAVQVSLLAHSRLDRPSDYRTWQERAYAYFTHLTSTATARQPAYETARMAHLEELSHLLLASRALDELFTLLAEVDHVPLLERSHRQRVDYYRAILQNEMYNYAAAQTGFQRLLADPGLDDGLRALTLNARGISYRHQGRFEDAMNSYQTARPVFARLGDRLGEAKVLTNLGILHIELGEYARALPILEAGLTIFREMNEPVRESDALLELGIAHGLLGDWQSAIKCFQACLEIAQRLGIADRIAGAYNNWAEIYFFMGRRNDAESMYCSALDIMQTPEYENRLGATETIMNLGFLAHTQDLYHQAEERYQQAWDLAEALDSDHHRALIGYRRADMHVRQDNLEAAYDELARAVDVIEAMRGRQASESIRMSLFDTRQQVYQSMVLLCLDLGQPAAALSYVERAKSRAFLDMLARPDAPESLPVETPLTAAEIQARLPADATLVEFFTTGSAGPSETLLANLPPESQHLRDYLAPPERLLAFVVTRANLCIVNLQGSIRQIEARHFNRSDGRLRGTTPLPGQPLRPIRRWHDLDAQLLQPLRPHLRNKQHVFLIPHSALHYLPLHALAGDPSASPSTGSGEASGQAPAGRLVL